MLGLSVLLMSLQVTLEYLGALVLTEDWLSLNRIHMRSLITREAVSVGGGLE